MRLYFTLIAICRILIIIPYPKINPIEVEELSSSDRNEGGFGSTDTNN